MRSRIAALRARRRLPAVGLALAGMLILALGVFASPASQPAAAFAAGADIAITSVSRTPNQSTYNIGVNLNVAIGVDNVGTGDAEINTVRVTLPLQTPGLTYVSTASAPGGLFTCTFVSPNVICRNTAGAITPATPLETITVTVTTNATVTTPITLTATAVNADDTNINNDVKSDTSSFTISGPTYTPTATGSPTPSLTPLPSFTPIPSATPTFTPTFIPPPATRTALPRPANAGQAVPIPPSGVSVVTNVPDANVRIVPAIGAELVASVPGGTLFENVQARSADSEWVRVNIAGQQGWIGMPVLTVLSGDIASLPVADPRTIPYGGFENPRAGLTTVTSGLTMRLADSGMRLRAGPSTGYPVFANPPRYSVMPVLGRTADNTWFQVNYEGVLGWVELNPVMEFNSSDVFTVPPVDGIVADALPFSDNTFDSYVDTLNLMLARLDIAQVSLDQIRAIWTTIAQGGQAQCGVYPDQPSDFFVPDSLLATYYNTLFPLTEDFNSAMTSIRDSIRLLIEVCSFPQPEQGSVGAGAVSVALQAVNNADALFPGLRQTIISLLPPDQPIGPNDCLFQFDIFAQVVPRLLNLTPVIVALDSNERVLGFCFDGAAGQVFRLEALRVNGNIAPRFTVSSFADPTAFIAQGELTPDEQYTSLPAITIPATGQYLIIVSDTNTPDGGLQGDLALMLTDMTAFGGTAGQGIALDANGNVITNPNIGFSVQATILPPSFQGAAVCPSIAFTCQQLLTCGEAQACLAAGNRSLDPDNDGLPCEENLCTAGTGGIFGGATAVPTDEPTDTGGGGGSGT